MFLERPEIVLASRNSHKYQEISEFFAHSGLRIIYGADLLDLDVEENGSSYSENAILKAYHWSMETGMPCLADDSGLEVESLGWWPGLYSSRVGENDEQRNSLILEKLEGKKTRTCRYVASFALFFPAQGQTWLTQGYCWGNISRQPSGTSGFGYDPLFVPAGYDKTFGYLGKNVKNRISHRAMAASSLLSMLSEVSVIK